MNRTGEFQLSWLSKLLLFEFFPILVGNLCRPSLKSSPEAQGSEPDMPDVHLLAFWALIGKSLQTKS